MQSPQQPREVSGRQRDVKRMENGEAESVNCKMALNVGIHVAWQHPGDMLLESFHLHWANQAIPVKVNRTSSNKNV